MESEIMIEERHSLRNVGSVLIYRWFNETSSTPVGSPIYLDLIEHILALVIIRSRRIERITDSEVILRRDKAAKRLTTSEFSMYSLEYWRVASAAAVIFHHQLSSLDADDHATSMFRVESLVSSFQDKAPELPSLPRSVELLIDKKWRESSQKQEWAALSQD
jgi:hypothetical protein